MTINLYNTMSRKIEEFKPLAAGQVGFYSCGPTVYWDPHIGNMRAYIHADIMKRMFLANGYDVRHVMNYTDVGHLTSDGDSGEDKMEKGAARENRSVWEIAQHYIDVFRHDSEDLNIIAPSKTTRATDYIQEQIELVQKLEKLGYTYEIAGDGIYYDTGKFAGYGALGGQNLSELRGGARIELSEGKRNPTDFALWKFSPADKKRAMEWESPWGIGFPGWHIECSAMSMAELGPHFDIHTGGIDHVKIHHTNEIAQSEPIVGKPWVNYWVHNEFLIDNTGKMSKSSGEFLTLSLLKSKGYDPMAYRYLILLGHYQSQLAFSWEALDAAANGYRNMVKKIASLFSADSGQRTADTGYRSRMLAAVSDNMKTAEAIKIFQDALRDESLPAADKLELTKFADELLGLQFMNRAQKLLAEESAPVPEEIQRLAADRQAAKEAKDWGRADELRAQIDAAGYAVQDGKDGMKIVRK